MLPTAQQPRIGKIGPHRALGGQGPKMNFGILWNFVCFLFPHGSIGPTRAPRGVFSPTPVARCALFLAGAKYVTNKRFFIRKKTVIWCISVQPIVQKTIEIEGVGPIWRDPRRNSANFPAWVVQNGWMATQSVTKRCDLGSLEVPGPASTPLAGLLVVPCLGLVWPGPVLPCLLYTSPSPRD